MLALDLPLLHDLLVDAFAMGSCTHLPRCHRALIESKCMNNGLSWTSIGEKGYHFLYRLLISTQPFSHGAFPLAKGFSTGMTPISWPFATMNADIACSDLPPCATRLIGAKLKRCVHWFFGFFHTQSMPTNACFFNSLLPFHQLLGSYHNRRLRCFWKYLWWYKM